MKTTCLTAVAALAACLALPALGADNLDARRLTSSMGEMASEFVAPGAERAEPETLRFEPWQMIDEMFTRDDVVYLMRHGPTDWSKLDVKDVAPDDCKNQRVLSPQGRVDMVNLGILMAHNEITPGQVVVSEWCRNQQTLDALLEGIASVNPDKAAHLRDTAITDSGVNLLLSLRGAPDVTALRERIATWDGGEGDGPLLIISHFTNIEELTTFTVYEGEALVLDPTRDSRVVGYFRLRSASPDVGHFNIDTDTIE